MSVSSPGRFVRVGVLVALVGWSAVVPVPRAVGAAVFFVSATGDRADPAPGDGMCADVRDVCTLRAAIQEANALAGADTIVLAPGTFRLSLKGTGPGGGDLDIHSSVAIEGAGAGRSVIDAGGVDGIGDRALEVDEADGAIQVALRHLDVRGGRLATGYGAGIRVAPAEAGLRLELEGVRLSGNRVVGDAATDVGGGLWVGPGAKVVAVETTVERNRAHVGGGVKVATGGSLRLQRSAVVDNRAFDGGGVVASGSVALVTSTVDSNAIGAGPSGVGGVLAEGGTLTISGSALVGGPSALGSSLGATVSISGSIVKGGCSLSGVTDDGGHNLDGGTTCGFGRPSDLSSTPPRLGTLADHGGPTPTRTLKPASRAIGAGGSCGGTDQRGVPRGRACDIGAYQYAECLGRPVNVVGTPGPDVIGTGGHRDNILSLGGNDIVRAGAGKDRVCTRRGGDWIVGGRGADRLKGGTGRDWCDGGRGPDLAVCEVERRVA